MSEQDNDNLVIAKEHEPESATLRPLVDHHNEEFEGIMPPRIKVGKRISLERKCGSAASFSGRIKSRKTRRRFKGDSAAWDDRVGANQLPADADQENAVRRYREDAEKGDDNAIKCLGVCYEHGLGVDKNIEEAIRLYREAAEKGNAGAIKCLGVCYQNGVGVDKDLEEAVRLYREANDDTDALKRLGICYQNGLGVDRNLEEAVRLFREAAAKGDADAVKCLGNCYETGLGVDENLEEAVRLYREAFTKGDADALKCLGICYQNGLGVDKNLHEAVRLYREAAEKGDASAHLGVCYHYGMGVEKSPEEASRLYGLADGNDLLNLGLRYILGRGVDQDVALGVQLHEIAAQKRHTRALSNLAFFHLAGFGVTRDRQRGKELCATACANGEDGYALMILADILASSLDLTELEEAESVIKRIPRGTNYRKFGLWLLPFIKKQRERLACDSPLRHMSLIVDNIEDAAIRPVARIGRGLFGKVYLCRYWDQWVAVKYLSVDLINKGEEDVVSAIMNERLICRMIKTENVGGVVGYIGLVEDLTHQHRGLVFELHANINVVETKARQILDRKFVVAQNADWDKLDDFTEYVTTSLRQAVVAPKGRCPNMKVVVRVLRDVAKAVLGLHRIGILHRDIADRNVLCDGAPNYNVKLADFGLSKIVGIPESEDLVAAYEQASHSDASMYPAAFMAPETVVSKDAVYSTASDVWSFGMLMFQCVSGSDPYQEITGQENKPYKAIQSELVASILEGYRPNLNQARDETPEALICLMKECWTTDPEGRPLVSSIIERLEQIMEGPFQPSRPRIKRTRDVQEKWAEAIQRNYQKLNYVAAIKQLSSGSRQQRLAGAGTFTNEYMRTILANVGHDVAPSTNLDKWDLRKLGDTDQRVYDIFIVHTGKDKKGPASTMKALYEPKGFQCFLDQASITAVEGPPPSQMQFALETCRYAVVLISKAFLERDDPCEELEYASRRMKWIRDNHGWESTWIILLDLSVEEYKEYRMTKKPSLPDISKQHRLYLYSEGKNGEYYDIPFLFDKLKSDLVESDKNKNAVKKWKSFLKNWPTKKDFPSSSMLYI